MRAAGFFPLGVPRDDERLPRFVDEYAVELVENRELESRQKKARLARIVTRESVHENMKLEGPVKNDIRRLERLVSGDLNMTPEEIEAHTREYDHEGPTVDAESSPVDETEPENGTDEPDPEPKQCAQNPKCVLPDGHDNPECITEPFGDNPGSEKETAGESPTGGTNGGSKSS